MSKEGSASSSDGEGDVPDIEESAKEVDNFDAKLNRKLAEIRKKGPVNFKKYTESGEVTQDECSFVDSLQRASTKEDIDNVLDHSQGYQSLIKIFNCVSEDDKKQLLVFLNDILSVDLGQAEHLNESCPEFQGQILKILLEEEVNDDLIRFTACQLLSKLLLAKNGRENAEDFDGFFGFLAENLSEQFPYLESVTRCLKRLLQVDEYRLRMFEMGVVQKLVQLLTRNLRRQIQYQICFCLWVLTFNANVAEKMSSTSLIPIVMDLLERCSEQSIKLPRVAMALIGSMLKKPESEETRRKNALLFIQCQIPRYLDLIEAWIKNINDQEFYENFEEVRNILKETIQEASSYEMYVAEVKSGHLSWRVIHNSKSFWSDNVKKFDENEHELLKILIDFLVKSRDALVLEVAAHDLCQYMLHQKRGKAVVKSLGGQNALIKLLDHQNGSVKYGALKCLHVLMLDKMYSDSQSSNKKKQGTKENSESFKEKGEGTKDMESSNENNEGTVKHSQGGKENKNCTKDSKSNLKKQDTKDSESSNKNNEGTIKHSKSGKEKEQGTEDSKSNKKKKQGSKNLRSSK